MRSWTFLTNHAYVLLCISRDPNARIRDIAATVGVTERAAQHIVNELVDAGYVRRTRIGNRNSYQLQPKLPFRIPIMQHRQIGSLLRLLADDSADEAENPQPSETQGGIR